MHLSRGPLRGVPGNRTIPVMDVIDFGPTAFVILANWALTPKCVPMFQIEDHLRLLEQLLEVLPRS